MYGLILRKSGTSLYLNKWISSWLSFSLICRLHRICLFNIFWLLSCRLEQQKHKLHGRTESVEVEAGAGATAAAASTTTSTSNMTRRFLLSSSSSSAQGNDAMLFVFFFSSSSVGRRQRPKYNHQTFFYFFLFYRFFRSLHFLLLGSYHSTGKIFIIQLQYHRFKQRL